jgi:DNA-directed RNA polymerase specialized sigma24 family protein
VFLSAGAIVKNDADGEEVAQEAVQKAFKVLGRLRQEAKFNTWLIQITINEAKMRLRKAAILPSSTLTRVIPDDRGTWPAENLPVVRTAEVHVEFRDEDPSRKTASTRTRC